MERAPLASGPEGRVTRRPSAPAVPYQVDYSTAKTGRHISPTKRRVRFVFGLASLPHLGMGCTGPDCRGYEHEVILLWSLTSGKRRILLDGREVHYSQAAHTCQSFEVSFPLPGEGNHILQLTAYASTPLGSPRTFRQFDIRLDGQSFAEMLKIYELGGRKCRQLYGHAFAYADSMPRPELEQAAADMRAARAASTGGGGMGIRRQVPDSVVQRFEDATYEGGGGDGDFDHMNPRSASEEQLMFEFARQKSLRGNCGPQRTNRNLPSATAATSTTSPGPGGQIPSFEGVHRAFKLQDPTPGLNRDRHQQAPSRQSLSATGKSPSEGRGMQTIDESEETDLIDLSSVVPSQQQQQQQQRPPQVQRSPSELTVDLPDRVDEISIMGDDDASSVGGWGVGPRMPPSFPAGLSDASFAYAPPPTWEQMNATFSPGAHPPPAPPQPGPPPPPSSVFAGPTAAAARPPPSVVQVGATSVAPTDASFAAYCAPPGQAQPGSVTASFAYAPPPTLEMMDAAFSPQSSLAPQWQQQQQQQRKQQHQQGGQPTPTNPFNSNYVGT